MEAYTGFALVYDAYMDNIPYEEWSVYLIGLLKEYGVAGEASVADLGCGTGTVTLLLDEAGYDCIGIDCSAEMLSAAAQKMYERGRQIIFSMQDMRDFALPYEADAMVSICDSMNYITTVGDLKSVFDCVYQGLAKGGVFIFDLKTVSFFRDVLADNTYAENREDSAFIWENAYDADTGNNWYDLAVFIKNEDGSFARYEESHCQHGFDEEEVRKAAGEAHLKVEAVYDAFTHEPPKAQSERLYFVLKKE